MHARCVERTPLIIYRAQRKTYRLTELFRPRAFIDFISGHPVFSRNGQFGLTFK